MVGGCGSTLVSVDIVIVPVLYRTSGRRFDDPTSYQDHEVTMAMRAPKFDELSASKPEVNPSEKDDPAWRALMSAPPLRSPLTEDEKKAIEAWKAGRTSSKA